MLIRHITANVVSTSGLIALVLAIALVALPTPSCATEFAWHSKGEAATWSNANYARKGAVDFRNGEIGSTLSYGTNYPMDNGLRPWKSQTVFLFADLSTVTVKMTGNFDPATEVTKGSGEIVNGTGRFEGVTGNVTAVGRFTGSTVEMDWSGTYSVPAAPPSVQQ